MDTYVWYSKGTKESGALLAGQMNEAKQGTTPPRGFKGAGICFGAKPADVFKWENRSFKALFNDPRRIAPLSADKSTIFREAARLGGAVVPTRTLDEDSDFEDVLRLLGGTSFYCVTTARTGAVQVYNQNELQSAFADGKVVAISENFKGKETHRVYIVNARPVVTLSKSFDPDKIIRKMASGDDGRVQADTYAKLKLWREQGRIALGKDEYVLEENIGAAAGFQVQPFIDVIGNKADMYCIEYVKVGGRFEATNIIFAPSLEALSAGAVSLMVTQIKLWIESNSKTFKESLLRLINESSEEEAEEMLGAINQYANG